MIFDGIPLWVWSSMIEMLEDIQLYPGLLKLQHITVSAIYRIFSFNACIRYFVQQFEVIL